MAIRTQIRLPQITGSFGDAEGKIVDNLPVAATLAVIPAGSGSMVSAMSQLASSIQRIHGGTAFTTNAAGVFSHDIKFDANNSLDFGDSTNNAGEVHTRVINSNDTLVIDSAGAMTIDTDGTDAINIGIEEAAKTITVGNDASTKVDVNALAIELDAANTVLLDGGKNAADAVKLNANNAAGGVQIYGGSGGFDLDVTSAGAGAGNGAVDIAAGLAMNLSAVNDMTLTTSAANKKIKLQSQFSGTGTGMQFQADSSAGSKMHFLAGVLDADVTGAATIDAGGAAHLKSTGGIVTLSGSNGATSVNVTSPATFGDNVVVTGTLTVNGGTTTIESTTVTIKDPVFEMGDDSSDDNLDRGLKLKYNNGGTKIAFIGLDDTDQKFVMIPDATDTSSVFSGTQGVLKADLEGDVTGDLTGIASQVTVTDSTANTAFPVVLHDESNALLDDTGTLTYNPSTALLKVSHVQVDSAAGDLISVESSDLTLAAAANLHLDATTAIALDAGANQPIKMQTNAADLLLFTLAADPRETGNAGTRPAQIKSYADSAGLEFKFGNTSALVVSGTAETGLLLSASNGKAMTLEAGLASGVINFTAPGQTGGPGLSFDFGTDRNAKIKDDQGLVHIQVDSANALTELYQNVQVDGTKKIQFGDSASFIHQSANSVLTIDGEATIDLNASTAVLVSNDLKLDSDDAVIGFGGDNEILLTHIPDVGLRLTEDGGGQPTLQFFDANESVSSDGSNLILTSGAAAFKIPTAHAAQAGQVLVGNGAGTLSFASIGSSAGAKHVKVLSASLSTGDRLTDSVNVANFPMDAVSAENSLKAIDVFVNGQLLQSSSDAFGSLAEASAGDYAINTDNMAASDVKFTFDLEADDTVAIIVRA